MLVHNWEFVKIEILRWVIEAANFKLMSLTENSGNVFIVVWYQVHVIVNPICMRCMDTDYGWDFRPKFRLRWKASRFVISSFLNGISYYDTEASGIVLSLRPSICPSVHLSVFLSVCLKTLFLPGPHRTLTHWSPGSSARGQGQGQRSRDMATVGP